MVAMSMPKKTREMLRALIHRPETPAAAAILPATCRQCGEALTAWVVMRSKLQSSTHQVIGQLQEVWCEDDEHQAGYVGIQASVIRPCRLPRNNTCYVASRLYPPCNAGANVGGCADQHAHATQPQ